MGLGKTIQAGLIEAARSLKVGPAEDPATTVGPLIDEESVARVRRYVELGRPTGRDVLVNVGPLADQGFYVGPHIFDDVPCDARLAQEETFGPVLAVLRAESLDEAFRIANRTDYALTGGIFSRSAAHLDHACRELLVGNLYLNRPITGAMVGRQPFGGFKMSGIGSQAGRTTCCSSSCRAPSPGTPCAAASRRRHRRHLRDVRHVYTRGKARIRLHNNPSATVQPKLAI